MGSKRAEMRNSNDLSTRDGKAVSLRKVIKKVIDPRPDNKITMLIPGTTGQAGIRNDANIIEINAEETVFQAEYFLKNIWPALKAQYNRLPAYLDKYLSMAFKGENEDNMKLMELAPDNIELKHIIGLIQLICGSLNMARKAGTGIRLYIPFIETYLHPKRERMIIIMLEEMKKDYGYDGTNSTKA